MPQFTLTVTDDGPLVRAVLRLPGAAPYRVLAAFTDPALVAQWWTGELTVTTLAPGTPYTVTFAKLGTALTGEVVGYEPGRQLEFSWLWDHEPGAVQRTAAITVAPDQAGGSTLKIAHGPHADAGPSPDGSEVTARAQHREGWEFFLPRLAALMEPDA